MEELKKGQIVIVRLEKMRNSKLECEFVCHDNEHNELLIFKPIRIVENNVSMWMLECVTRCLITATAKQIVSM